MKTVALISGGKDSCYNMIQCISEGHSIVALANLKPKDKGLQPKHHLGKTLSEMRDYLHKKNAEFELNVCGEGGEYETFTLDCPIFKKKIVIDEMEMVIHSDDAFAPVGYLNLKKAHLEDKKMDPSQSQLDLIKGLPIKHSRSLLDELFPNRSELRCVQCEKLQRQKSKDTVTGSKKAEVTRMKSADSDWRHIWVTNLMAVQKDEDVEQLARQTMDNLQELIKPLNMSDLVLMHLYVKNMADFAAINAVYKTYFGLNPAARVCVEAQLPDNVAMMLDCYGNSCHSNRETMHVQGLSHWAPANIGPYSQCTKVGNVCYVAGQIGMVPANLALIDGGIHSQTRLSLQHVNSVLSAMCSSRSIYDIITCVCYVTHPDYIPIATQELDCTIKDPSCMPVYVVIPQLPKGALIEWQAVAKTDVPKPLQVERNTNCKRSMYTSKARMIKSSEAIPLSLVISLYKIEGNDIADINLESVIDVLEETRGMFTDISKETSDAESQISMMRIFYQANVFNYDTLYEGMQRRFRNRPVALVPVIQLETMDILLSLCETFN
ncbi:uncharacterized protein LOC132718499 [Ruditapes philippinarum]|uniref:uncharacterized protein LOC132718499 n=1 Tax=Ruditapes philippinarum TaxID=129788 RepID=UPI00295A765D|nr:uncharacterized protein LOC132718499 [Ruditapes philippinarum]